MKDYNIPQSIVNLAMDQLATAIDTDDDYALMIQDVNSKIISWAKARYSDSWEDMSMVWLSREYWANQGYQI
jgi:hypothetical protein